MVSLVMNDDDEAVRPLTENEAKNLSHILKSKSLPGLNENDRMHLVAMVNTIVEVNIYYSYFEKIIKQYTYR
jgi:hypothetical protein